MNRAIRAAATYAWRTMDEILLANFMVFHDLLEAEPFDLVVADEAWDLDYHLHENPELKRAAFAWMTDYEQASPEGLAHAILDGLRRPVLSRGVEPGAARRAAQRIARLL